ncbi:bifunctional DNA primase/polymerase [Streptomyces sp. DSM 44917]|uniref:Bifunctional DNA primase/polymerase n=1 Tax=Streptomyces boetiae TaxID=3075541 RepID=A0ABU2L1Z5_9ACTN|nr:bifunctional DNA primase/polymerase [Streptomyces sp. DSM 44917]MDT0305368.1 bifunctional DNA primase/polymerase [Streptomyces sp. DSM 44917]
MPEQRDDGLLEQAVRYVKERHWEVLPGAWIEFDAAGAALCSCAAADCGAPGVHPLRPGWGSDATGSETQARRLWTREPRASVLLPTGRTFDVLEVSEGAGCLALARMERMGASLGPVAGTPLGRMLFFVMPGGAAKVPGKLRQLGWAPASLDLTVRGEGDFVAAPPSRLATDGTVRGRVHWIRRPTPVNRWLPDPAELLAPLAYACAQED